MHPSHSAAPERLLSFAVMGAGAVGCYFGALLARAGHGVTLIGRDAHVRAIRGAGLRLQTQSEDLHLPMAASTEASAASGADVVLLCVKSADTEEAARQLLPHVRPDTLVLTLQNGVDNDLRAAKVLGSACEVAPAVVYVATAMAGAGHVRHYGRGDLVIAPSARSAELARQLQAAGIPTQISDNVRGALWAKLIINSAYNALSAVLQQPYGWLMQQPGAADVVQDIVNECLAVARAEGVQLPGDIHAALRSIVQTMPGQLSSTAQDLARGKTTEIEHLNGYVVRRGDALGIATPVNRTMLVLVRMLEQRQAGQAAG
ncbi:ketopantoate reductase family protein [Comamonas sp. NLF-1-9]|uniref:ketopantoate reductase family protein n=1 Tax=Comamonas sp. NLF-1-9 TaxID=2853163 RepID=UPI001C4952F0|nr:ketopantoate reductase family protein [Comamonas sp. NLF-1-9]QXL85443.1 ketopantoate reductase family protein [Comamonas sp. NLF-1-9]